MCLQPGRARASRLSPFDMSADAFAALLRRLGCPEVPAPGDLQWLLKDDKTRPFVDWITANIAPEANLLSAKELEA
jgi:hypothetical protein